MNFKLTMVVPAIVLLLTACISTSSQGVSKMGEAKSASDKRAEILERYNVDFLTMSVGLI